MKNTIAEADLDKLTGEQLAVTECLIMHLGGPEYIDPHHENADQSVCTFMCFMLRDVLEYLGLAKNTCIDTEQMICKYKAQIFEPMNEILKK